MNLWERRICYIGLHMVWVIHPPLGHGAENQSLLILRGWASQQSRSALKTWGIPREALIFSLHRKPEHSVILVKGRGGGGKRVDELASETARRWSEELFPGTLFYLGYHGKALPTLSVALALQFTGS